MTRLVCTHAARAVVEASLIRRLSMGCGESLRVFSGGATLSAAAVLQQLRGTAERPQEHASAQPLESSVRR